MLSTPLSFLSNRAARSVLIVAVCSIWLSLLPDIALGLPFNQDMVGTQLSNGAVMRPAPNGAVAVGSSERFVGTKREDALKLQNPVPASAESVANGARLYQVNCSMCHGRYRDGQHIPGAVSQYLPGPNLALPFYQEKSDAHFFQFIHFGGLAIMPAYGWKFSMTEHWDLVNYIREVQTSAGGGGE